MRPIPTTIGGFGWEKLCFLSAAAVFSGAMYHFLISAPLALHPAAPISCSEALPVRASDRPISARFDEESYVYSSVDGRSGAPINRERLRPFEPVVSSVVVAVPPHNVPPVLPPLQDVPDARPNGKSRDFAPIALASAVEYMGVFSANSASYGLLRRKDGSGNIKVKEGSEFTIGTEKYRVERLEKQAICVTCEEVRVLLKNDRFGGELSARDRLSEQSRSF